MGLYRQLKVLCIHYFGPPHFLMPWMSVFEITRFKVSSVRVVDNLYYKILLRMLTTHIEEISVNNRCRTLLNIYECTTGFHSFDLVLEISNIHIILSTLYNWQRILNL